MNTRHLVTRKDSLATAAIRAVPDAPLAAGQVRIDLDRFALTANNITYGAFGDAMDYWRFFPVTDEAGADDPAWGHIPVWGFGSVVQSTHPGVAVGERLYGYFPMASQAVLTPARLAPHAFSDGAPHRAGLHAVYNQYSRCSADPFYTRDSEDLQALLRPLFTTAWLIDDFLADNGYFLPDGARARMPAMLLSSASSKTAFATAFQMRQRGGTEVVGLTSARNVAFCESLGCYHRVLTYERLGDLAPQAPAVYVDFAGNAAFRKALHTHCTGLTYSSSIGGTHVGALGGGRDLPGPKPTLFFAPAQIKKRHADWGAQRLAERLVASWQQFLAAVASPRPPWVQVQRHAGADAALTAYQTVLTGQGDARIGHILSL